MTHEETIQKLMEMKLLGMVALLREWLLGPPTHGLTFEEQLAFLVDREWSDRHNRVTARRLKDARLPVRATLEDVWCKPGRGIDRAVVRGFATGQWIRAKQNIIAVGRTGVGKSYLSAALAEAACRLGVEASTCLALEDSHNGVRAAHAAGMMTVMVPDLLEATAEMHDLCITIARTLHDVRVMIMASEVGRP